MVSPFVSQYLLCIYLLLREWMWVLVFFYIQISIIPINIMFICFLYEVILTLHVKGQKDINMFLIVVVFCKGFDAQTAQ